MDRRRVLLGLGAAAGLGAAGGLAWVQPRRGWLVPPEDGPATVTGSPRVVVVGGGLAGISAAAELASRGCRVTLVEQGPHLGGKLGGWDVTGILLLQSGSFETATFSNRDPSGTGANVRGGEWRGMAYVGRSARRRAR